MRFNKIDSLVKKAKGKVVGDVRPIPYYGDWDKFKNSGISHINSDLY